MRAGVRSYKGRFNPQNREKYKGDVSQIVFRSLLELRAMKYFDTTPNILEWSSEEIVIPYVSPVDGRSHRYFPDFYVKAKLRTGEVIDYLVEVKPQSQVHAPSQPKKSVTKRYLQETVDWAINCAKWEAAKKICKDNGWHFMLLTDRHLKPGATQ